MTRLTRDAVDGVGSRKKEADRCKNFFALGLVYWLYDRDPKPTDAHLDRSKFAPHPPSPRPTCRAFRAGFNYGYSTESFTVSLPGSHRQTRPGKYRKISRQRSHGLRAGDCGQAGGEDPFLRRLPDHPRQRHPARAVAQSFGVKYVRPRTKSPPWRRCRGRLRRGHRGHRQQRPGDLPQGRERWASAS